MECKRYIIYNGMVFKVSELLWNGVVILLVITQQSQQIRHFTEVLIKIIAVECLPLLDDFHTNVECVDLNHHLSTTTNNNSYTTISITHHLRRTTKG